jgi:cell division protein FtsL
LNSYNIIIIIASVIIVGLFFGSVFINLSVKNDKIVIEKLNGEIDNLKQDIRKLDADIAEYTNPYRVLKYIEENDLKPVPLKRKHTIYVEKN